MPIFYKNIEYAGLYDLHRSIVQKPMVSVEIFCSRIRSRRIKNNGELSDLDISQALFLDKHEYFSRYAKRKTELTVDGKTIILEEYFEKYSGHAVSYGSFRQRALSLNKRHILDNNSLNDALSMDNSNWISFYGGGRKRGFVYEGDLYPKYCGKYFNSVTSFLRTVGKYSEKATIWSRLKKNWRLDDAISEPVLSIDERPGKIYLIENSCTHEKYVGLTVMSLQNRWGHHLRTAFESISNTPLHKSIREFGKDNFTITCIEENLSQDILPEKEKYWIETLDTIIPNGLNVLEGGQTGGGRRKKIIYGGVEYASVVQATYLLSQKTGLPEHVVAKRLLANEKMPVKARTHSKHPDAGSNLWRRWKQLIRDTRLNIRNGEIANEWFEYDNFKNDTLKTYNPELCLTRKDETLPWGKNNFEWTTKKERVTKTFGGKYIVEGIIYNSLTAVAEKYEINLTTLKYRIDKLHMNVEEAVNKKLGKTSKNNSGGIVFEGIRFDSANKAHIYAAQKYNISLSKAKDRITRGLPLDKPDHAIPCVVNGINFKSESAAAAHFGINKSTFQKRKRLGWSLEQALGLIAKEA